jgi:DNA-directed RNA polymerase subunit RPC12/RpoP
MAENLSLEIREHLKSYKQHTAREVTCLECGYKGIMGIVPKSAKVPWYFTWYVLIPLCLTGIGIVPAIILGFFRAMSKKHLVACPECKRHLGPI